MEITQLPLSPYFYINLYHLDLEIKIHLLWPDFNFGPDVIYIEVLPEETHVHHRGTVHGQ